MWCNPFLQPLEGVDMNVLASLWQNEKDAFVSKLIEIDIESIEKIKGAKTPKQCGANHSQKVDMNSSRMTGTKWKRCFRQ